MDEMLLLAHLEKNATMSRKLLAEVLQAEESDVLATLSELEREQVICGYHTIINWNQTNKDHISAIIFADATPQRDAGYQNIARKIYNYPEVESMHLMSGKSDFLLMVHGKTMKDVADFVATKLACIDGISATSTLFIMQTYKSNSFIFEKEESKHTRLVVTP